MIAPCDKCKADCCANLPINKVDYKRMCEVVPRLIPKHKIDKPGVDGVIIIKGRCLWLDKNNRCTVYDVRPEVCRSFGTEKSPCTKMPGGKEASERRVKRMKHFLEQKGKLNG